MYEDYGHHVLLGRIGRPTIQPPKIVSFTFPDFPPRDIDLLAGPLPMSWNEQVLVAIVQIHAPLVAVEIGVLFGQTTAALAAVLPSGGKIYGLDVNIDRPRPYIDLWPELWERIELLGGDSTSTLGQVPDGIGFAYIDGAHEEPQVRREIEILWPKLAPSAIVAFHDANDPGVRNVASGLANSLWFLAGPGTMIVQKR